LYRGKTRSTLAREIAQSHVPGVSLLGVILMPFVDEQSQLPLLFLSEHVIGNCPDVFFQVDEGL
jgi:hypothetical protein